MSPKERANALAEECYKLWLNGTGGPHSPEPGMACCECVTLAIEDSLRAAGQDREEAKWDWECHLDEMRRTGGF